MNDKYLYDVAVSYQREAEKRVEKVVDYLQIEDWDVFFAPARQEEMISEKLHAKLYDVYKNKSLLKVLFITGKYMESEWTQLEMSVAVESTRSENRRLMIVNFLDGKSLPEKLKQFVFIDGNRYYEHEIAGFISKRLQELTGKSEGDVGKKMEQGDGINKFVIIDDNHGVISGRDVNMGDIYLNGDGKGV